MGRLAEYMGWVHTPDPQEAARQEAAKTREAARPSETAQTAPLPAFAPSPGRDLTVQSPLYEAVVYTGGGTLRSFKLKKYQAGLAPDSPLVNLVDPQTAGVAPLGLVINSQPSWSNRAVVFGNRRAGPASDKRAAGRAATDRRGGQFGASRAN